MDIPDYAGTNKEVIKSTQYFYNTVFKTNPDYLFITDIQGTLIKASPFFLSQTGFSETDLQHKTLLDFISQKNRDKLNYAVYWLRQGHVVIGLDFYLLNKAKKTIRYEVNAVPNLRKKGVDKMIFFARNSHTKSVVEKKLREAEKQYLESILNHWEPYINTLWTAKSDKVKPVAIGGQS